MISHPLHLAFNLWQYGGQKFQCSRKCKSNVESETIPSHIQLLEYVIPPAAAAAPATATAAPPKSPLCYGVSPCYGVTNS